MGQLILVYRKNHIDEHLVDEHLCLLDNVHDEMMSSSLSQPSVD